MGQEDTGCMDKVDAICFSIENSRGIKDGEHMGKLFPS